MRSSAGCKGWSACTWGNSSVLKRLHQILVRLSMARAPSRLPLLRTPTTLPSSSTIQEWNSLERIRSVCVLDARAGRQNLWSAVHDLLHGAATEFFTCFVARQMNAVLLSESLINRLFLEPRRDEKTRQISDHQRHDNRVIACHFKYHQDGSHGRTNDSGEKRAHAHQRVCSRRGSVGWQPVVGHCADGTSQHCSEKRLGPNIPPALPEA